MSRDKKANGVREAGATFEVRKTSANGLKVRRIGNSLGVVLPKDLLAGLGAKEGDVLSAIADQRGELRLVLQDPDVERLKALADGIMEKRRKVLRVLAK